MLLSFLISLTPTLPLRLDGFFGREAQAWLLRQLARHAPNVAETLHAGNGPRPYTVSSLIVPEAGRRAEDGEVWLIPKNECLLRFTSLASPLSELLLEQVLPNLPRTLRLRGSEFRVLGLARENAWWGEAEFDDLLEPAELLEPGGRRNGPSVTLEFASPTAFRSGSVDQTLPTPELVWKSLWQRWNSFAPEPLQIDPLWPEFAGKALVVSDFQLRSLKVLLKNGEKGGVTGCTGKATYRLLRDKHLDDYAPYRAGAEGVLRSLAAFALFSGVGHHTTIGMGQARWLS